VPIKPENRHRYPADWPQIRERILQRSGYRCEHPGCTASQYAVGFWSGTTRRGVWVHEWVHEWPRDGAYMGQTYSDARAVALGIADAGVLKPIVIVLTIAHLDHQPENCSDDNLRALCQRHHLAHDAQHHKETAYATRRARAPTPDLFG
jgi:hypothetical protein